jgi:hypothetical protein
MKYLILKKTYKKITPLKTYSIILKSFEDIGENEWGINVMNSFKSESPIIRSYLFNINKEDFLLYMCFDNNVDMKTFHFYKLNEPDKIENINKGNNSIKILSEVLNIIYYDIRENGFSNLIYSK